jgi:hypothetical protein
LYVLKKITKIFLFSAKYIYKAPKMGPYFGGLNIGVTKQGNKKVVANPMNNEGSKKPRVDKGNKNTPQNGS